MEIGEPEKIETDVPRPIRVPRVAPAETPREAPRRSVPVDPPRAPVRQPSKTPVPVRQSLLTGYCPMCGRWLDEQEEEGRMWLVCPTHGFLEEVAYA